MFSRLRSERRGTTITCADGTSVTIEAPDVDPQPRGCSVREDGTDATLSCDDGTSYTFSTATPCRVLNHPNGFTLGCEDGTSVTRVDRAEIKGGGTHAS